MTKKTIQRNIPLLPMADDTVTDTTPGLNFLRYVLENLCDDADALSIEASTDELGILLTVTVSENDMGKLIGKSGQTVKALRTLLRIIGGNHKQRINLKILEPTPLSS